MRRLRYAILFCSGVAAVMASFSACYWISAAHAQAEAPTPVTTVVPSVVVSDPTNTLAVILLGVIAGMSAVRTVLQFTAPRTKTVVDDRVLEAINAVLEMAGRRGTTTNVVIEQPKPQHQQLQPRDPQSGRATAGLVAAITAVAVAALALQPGCAQTTREATIKTALVTVDSTSKAFTAYSKAKHEQIARAVPTRAEGERRLTELEAKEDVVIKAFMGAYAAIGIAATLNEDQGRDAIRSAIEQVLAAFNAMTRGVP